MVSVEVQRRFHVGLGLTSLGALAVEVGFL